MRGADFNHGIIEKSMYRVPVPSICCRFLFCGPSAFPYAVSSMVYRAPSMRYCAPVLLDCVRNLALDLIDYVPTLLASIDHALGLLDMD